MALFLRDDDVRACVTMDAMIDSIESMQRHYGAGEAVNLTRRKIIADTGMLSVMGGGSSTKDCWASRPTPWSKGNTPFR